MSEPQGDGVQVFAQLTASDAVAVSDQVVVGQPESKIARMLAPGRFIRIQLAGHTTDAGYRVEEVGLWGILATTQSDLQAKPTLFPWSTIATIVSAP